MRVFNFVKRRVISGRTTKLCLVGRSRCNFRVIYEDMMMAMQVWEKRLLRFLNWSNALGKSKRSSRVVKASSRAGLPCPRENTMLIPAVLV
jgi:hypothetical protein